MAGSKSLLAQYQEYIDNKARGKSGSSADVSSNLSTSKYLNVGIIGGGISGLYSALLLQKYVPDVKVTIFEASGRLGGNIYTYNFSSEPNQYFEAGAMRIPLVEGHIPVFSLINYLNEKVPKDPIQLIDYFYSCPSGNRVLVNGTKQKDGRVMNIEYANKHCSELGFPTDSDKASLLLERALAPVIKELAADFNATMEKYMHVSLHNYLSKDLGWSDSKIDYVEVMTCQTSFFQRGLLEIILFQCDITDAKAWKTIDSGMSKLIKLSSEVVMMNGGNILLNANVESVVYIDSDKVKVGYTDMKQPTPSKLTYKVFDAIIMAIPPHSIRIMLERPRWSPELEYALRTMKSYQVTKIGLLFNTRFWESSNLQHPPSHGGRSITDLPSTWIEYPSYGIGDSGKGVLHIFCYIDGPMPLLSKSKLDKIRLILRDLQLLYPEVDIAKEYAGGTDPHTHKFLESSFVMEWALESPTCALGYPSQLCSLYPIMVQPQGGIYFAGCHLSIRNCWIVGAIESARRAVQQLLSKTMDIRTLNYI